MTETEFKKFADKLHKEEKAYLVMKLSEDGTPCFSYAGKPVDLSFLLYRAKCRNPVFEEVLKDAVEIPKFTEPAFEELITELADTMSNFIKKDNHPQRKRKKRNK